MTLDKTIIWEQPEEMLNLPKFLNKNVITLCDFTSLITLLSKNSAGRLNMKLEELEPLIQSQNKEFFDLKDKIFKENPFGISPNSEEFKSLRNLLKLPTNKERKRKMVSNTCNIENKDKATEVFELFNSLSTSEKIEFILKIQKGMSITLTPLEIMQYFSKE